MRILIIRPGAIGDTLLTLPVIQALRQHHANPHITFIGNAAVLPLMLASGMVEEVSDYQSLQWSELFSSRGIQHPGTRAMIAQANLVICWLRDPDGIVERNLYNAGAGRVIVAPGRPAKSDRTHIVQYLAQTIGLQASEANFVLRLPDAPQHVQQTIAIHPGSGGAQKCWPSARFVAVIQHFLGKGQRVLLLGGPADRERLQLILDALPEGAEQLEIMQDASLMNVAYALLKCKCYLGNDSGITHLAALLGVPTLALFGASDPAVWHPVGKAVKVIAARSLEDISIYTVIETLKAFTHV